MTETHAEAPGPDAMLDTFLHVVADLRRALRWYRYAAVVLLLTLAGIIAGGVGLYETQHSQCLSGNNFRASDEANWDDFITLALGPHPKPESVRQASILRADIHARDTRHSCPSVMPWD